MNINILFNNILNKDLQCFSINDNMILGISSCIKFIFYIFKALND